MRTHYDNLKIKRNASMEEVKAAYRSLAQKWHPDKHENKKLAERNFKIINQAYYVLSDKQRRREYDASILLDEMEQPDTPPATKSKESNNYPVVFVEKVIKASVKKAKESLPFFLVTAFFVFIGLFSFYSSDIGILNAISKQDKIIALPLGYLVILLLFSLIYLASMFWLSKKHGTSVVEQYDLAEKLLNSGVSASYIASLSLALVIISGVIYLNGA